MMDIINSVGFISPLILILYSIRLLWDKQTLIVYYLVGLFCNTLLNYVLKGIIKQPRPSQNEKLINLALNNGRVFSYDIYGMPSGHAQSSLYSTIFIWLVFQNKNILILYLFLTLLTMYNRINTKSHTILQVIVGAIIGTIMGYFIFYIATKKIKGKFKPKEEDNAPY
jgi:undecaprenyl-diphosphatase